VLSVCSAFSPQETQQISITSSNQNHRKAISLLAPMNSNTLLNIAVTSTALDSNPYLNHSQVALNMTISGKVVILGVSDTWQAMTAAFVAAFGLTGANAYSVQVDIVRPTPSELKIRLAVHSSILKVWCIARHPDPGTLDGCHP
jgi:hypothetical protein